MKSFKEYYENGRRSYKFKVRLADDVDSEMMDCIERGLAPYSVVSVSKPKSLPIQENPINFENLGPVPINIVEFELEYPTTVDNLRTIIARETKLGEPKVFVTTEGQESLQLTRVTLDPDGKPLLTKEYEDSPDDVKKLYGDENIEITLKSISKKKFKHEFEKPSNEPGMTLNDSPVGTISPVGSTQNKLPKPFGRKK